MKKNGEMQMLEVIAGCMYAGKSEELIRRLKRCQIAGLSTLAMKPAIDDRYSADSVATHIGETLKAVPVKSVAEVRAHLAEHPFASAGQVIGLDEVQFMDHTIVGVLEEQANMGRRVIVAGLDLDSDGHPFGPMAELLAVADKVTKLTAVCVAHDHETGGPCGKPATRSYRVTKEEFVGQVKVGSFGVYEARCRVCWTKPSEVARISRENCWTCRFDSVEEASGAHLCHALVGPGVEAWVESHVAQSGDIASMPPHDAPPCPGWELK
jgi:thymidine kinase